MKIVTPGQAFYIALACSCMYVHMSVTSLVITALNDPSARYIMQNFILLCYHSDLQETLATS